MKVLFIEDDCHTSELITAMLFAQCYAVDAIADGVAGLDLAIRWDYDLILLDVMLPGLNGIEVCRRLRAQGCKTPILMLTAKDADEDIVAGLDAGADDYLIKTSASSQLLARLRALLRRGNRPALTPMLNWGLLCLDPAIAQVTYQQKAIALRPKEYALLELFLRNPHRILSRSTIIEHLWSMDDTPVEGSITNLIKDLRQRLKSAGMNMDLIETVYGLGYRLKTAPTAIDGVLEDTIEEPSVGDRSIPATTILATDAWLDWDRQDQPETTRLQHIKQRFQGSLQQRIEALEIAERALQAGNFNFLQQQAACADAHKLAGGLGTFGYRKASEIARAIENLLEATLKQETQLTYELSQLVEALKQELQKHASPTEPSRSRDGATPVSSK